MLHDRFYARWDQPISLLQSGQELTTVVTFKLDDGGHVVSASIAKESGNPTMDDSVMTAARSVTQVDPPPKGFSHEFNIAFQLNP
jgi:TonB family protein